MHKSEKISLISVFLNILLFFAKLIFGLISQSLSLISDAFNSLLDVISYTGIHIAVKISNKKADKGHPFGHHRAEPIAGLIIAIFAGILGFEIISSAVKNIITPREISFSTGAIIVLIISIFVKTGMAFYLTKKGKELNRPSIKAAGIDSRNDVFASGVAVIGVIGPWLGFPILDSIASILISLFIFYSGYEIAMENIDYLMGHAPSESTIKKIKEKTINIAGVKGINDVKAHYVGSYIHVEVHVEVDKKINTEKSHDIGKKVQYAIEDIDQVDKAFIHIDPI
jgi:cation diffusion facilitator family transporter